MKRIIVFIMLSLAICQNMNAQIQDVVTFSYDNLTIDTMIGYTKVSMLDYSTTDIVGHPELPRLEVKYIIPFDKQVSNVTVTDSLTQILQGDFTIYPAQYDVPVGDIDRGFTNPDPMVYGSSNLYFSNTIEYIGQFYEFGYHVALFYIYPLNYIPAQNKLIFCSSISFTIQLSNYNSNFPRPKMASRRMFEMTKKLVTSSVRNVTDFNSTIGGPLKIVEPNEKVSVSLPLLQNTLDIFPEYIVITNNSDIHGNEIEPYNGQTMTKIFQTFADWKTKKGVPTVVVTIDDICANYSGNDIQSKIHDFLADVYQEYGTMYVLFGGDVNVVPERMSDITLFPSTQYEARFSFPTDLYYTAIETSWDSNGNGLFGEFPSENGDIIDNTPDFLYGRIPVENSYEAAIFLNKILTYENMTNIDNTHYVNNVVMMVGMINDNQSGYQKFVRNHGDAALGVWIKWNNGITKTVGIINDSVVRWRLFENFYVFDDTSANNTIQHSIGWENHSPFLCRNNVIGALGTGFNNTPNNEFPHLVFHTDHSSYLSLGTSTIHSNEKIDRNDVEGLLNAPYYHILMTQGCSPGEYQKDCIVERFLNNPNGGSVAVLASASTSYRDAEAYYQTIFLSSCYNFSRLNSEITYASLYNIGNVYHYVHQDAGNNEMGLFIKRKNHLFGDPELPIWTREPVDLTVSTSPYTITNQNGQLTVSVSGMAYSEYATNDVYVCVMKDGEVYQREHYDGTAHNHDFVFDVNPETAGTLKVTVTGHNYIPYETTVPVSITGKNVYISNKVVIDGSGNSNGSLDAGETVNLSISLKNNGTVNLTNVRADLSCEFLDDDLNQHINDYLTLNTSTASFGSIAKNATVTRNSYQMTLSNAIPDRSSLRCTLVIRDGSGVICTRSFTLSISAPEIEHVSVRHETKPNGRIGLDIELNNIGFGAAKGVVASLASSSGVQITQGTATYGAMPHLEAKNRPFEFIPNGNVNGKSFTLTVTDAYNKSWSYNFTLYNMLNTVENLTFENTEHSIKLRWDPVEDSRGYYVYRSLTSNGNYERLNSYPIPSSVYPDMGLGAKQTYYYGVSYLDEHGNESEKAHITAWTSLPIAEGWPISIPDDLGRVWGTASNVADINGDGHQEIFLTTGTGDLPGNVGAILGFNCLGEELYDIDHNPTTISGFANIGISMTSTPAVGDIDNDGVMEVVIATRCDENGFNYKLCVYKNIDVNTDGVPDLAWERPIDYKNFNGVVLADLDDNGTLEIITPNQGKKGEYGYTYLEVFNCFGEYYYPKNTIRVLDMCNMDGKAVTMPVIADLDNDGYKEIVFGLEGGIYSWSCRTEQLSTLVPFNGNNKERTDCPVIAADIDGDGDKEILYIAIKNGIGYIRVINLDGTSVNGWNGDTHFVSLSGNDPDYEWPPYFSVGDIDNDGSIEVIAADNGVLKMWTSSGSTFGIGQIQIPNLECRYFQPIIADVDGNGDCEIIIPSQNGYIYAYKTNGNAVPGWPLAVTELGTIPAVTDIDGDGYNEVVAASQTEVYVWHTEGESKYNQCDRFRYNEYNNAVYEVPCSYVSTPLEISNTQVWNDERQCNMDVVINNGAGLTIKSAVRFSANAKIIVKPGGRLVIDGGTLTNSCSGEMWPGIEVWGNSAAHQYPVNGHYAQGYVELKNGAVIENAVCALNLWRPSHWGTTGGIVHAENTTFRNCAKAVHALHYANHHPATGKETAYNSRFRNCTFAIDNGYLGTTAFHKHADLNHVDGISFIGCDFSADRTAANVSPWCIGIAAYTSGFKATSFCDYNGSNSGIHPCPDELVKGCSFSGFHEGIFANNDGSAARTFLVSNGSFRNNKYGIHALNTGFATILHSDFVVGSGNECAFGIHADHVAGFCIEENSFRAQHNGTGDTYGIAISDSHGTNDIYRNTFSGLACGNLAVGTNIADGLPVENRRTMTGLTYTCNENEGNDIDFCVLDGGAHPSGIQEHQGSLSLPAGNTFSGNLYHFYNEGDDLLTYYYFNGGQPGQEPAGGLLYRVTHEPSPNANDCPSHYGNGGPVLSEEERAAACDSYFLSHTAYESLERVYGNRLDGGNTAAQTAHIEAATPADMWQLRAQLLSRSPYLSQEVLTAAADRDDVFPEMAQFEILAANPDELKKDTLIRYLENKDNPLPHHMTDLLRVLAEGTTDRTVLMAQMGRMGRDFSLAAADIVRSNLNDSLADPDELRTWLANMECLDADRLAVASLVQEGDFSNALALAGSLPQLYGMQDGSLDEHDDYMLLLGLYQSLHDSNRNASELDAAEVETVEGIAEQGRGAAKAMAKSLLRGLSDDRVPSIDCPRLPDAGNGGRGGTKPVDASLLGMAMGLDASVRPNPATSWAVIDYTLPLGATKATLTFTNALGVAVMTAELNGSQGQKVLDLRPLAAGVYGYDVRCGEYVLNGKMVVTK